jgi:hypothetical protein
MFDLGTSRIYTNLLDCLTRLSPGKSLEITPRGET